MKSTVLDDGLRFSQRDQGELIEPCDNIEIREFDSIDAGHPDIVAECQEVHGKQGQENEPENDVFHGLYMEGRRVSAIFADSGACEAYGGHRPT